MAGALAVLSDVIEKKQDELLRSWMNKLVDVGALRSGQTSETEFRDVCRRFLDELRAALADGAPDDVGAPAWAGMRAILDEVSSSRAVKGYSPSETAQFVFSFKAPLFEALRARSFKGAEQLAEATWGASMLLDRLGLYTVEVFQKSREEVIRRQQAELLELSTPVVQLWDKILALPLIGTLDSARTQIIMENLLQSIVDVEAEIAIIDITGVPAVDTLVAQHLIKTISAARLMGAECIISGIRPQIAQTIVHLGLDLSVVSKATMADAFALALRRTGQTIETASARRS